jgi:hypothetical protein
MGAVMTVNAYGLLLAIPVCASIVVVSVVPFSMLTLLIPLLVVAAAAFFLPFGLGNTHISRLVCSLAPAAASGEGGFVVQLTLAPRMTTGLRATLEDADDVGWLSLGKDSLVFTGDAVKLVLPYDQIEKLRPKNIGLRGGFVYGRRIRLVVKGLPEAASMEFAERSSWLLPTSRRITRELYEQLSAKIAEGSKPALAGHAAA